MKKKIRLLTLSLSITLVLSILSGCAAGGAMDEGDRDNLGDILDGNNSLYPEVEFGQSADNSSPTEDNAVNFVENPFVSVSEAPISTFSADVDTASYAYFRKLAGQGYTLDQLKNQIKNSPLRTEEMVNYFDYTSNLPENGEIFGTKAMISKTPWNDSSYLLMLRLATERIREKGANNLVFLIDVSGSMSSDDKLPLLQKSFANLVSALDENDTVSIVTYSGKEEVVLSGCKGNRDEEIMNAINSLKANGSTNGEAGLTRAYSLAKDYYIADGNNRIIMASDGDLNVGISSADELKSYIEGKRNEGIFLSVMGFGTGNYNDGAMSALAENGNGVYYYIDGEREAEKVLGEDLLSTLYTVAKDVKLQLEFDATYVEQYRLIGYESRLLSNEDFEDDTKDAGDVGAGHSVTVCYELILTYDALKEDTESFSFARLDLRYKLPNATESVVRSVNIESSVLTDTPDGDFHFVSAVIETSMILNGSRYNEKDVTLTDVLALIEKADISGDVDKQQFKAIISELAK